ncbi:unnamed protein product [Arctogadus glacialis]
MIAAGLGGVINGGRPCKVNKRLYLDASLILLGDQLPPSDISTGRPAVNHLNPPGPEECRTWPRPTRDLRSHRTWPEEPQDVASAPWGPEEPQYVASAHWRPEESQDVA